MMNRHITQTNWRRRESDLVWGAPMTLFPALAIGPVTISFLLEPAFAHARVLGCLLVPLIAASIAYGLSRLASCFRRDFDVLTLFAGGTIVVLMVIAMATGIILANEIGNL